MSCFDEVKRWPIVRRMFERGISVYGASSDWDGPAKGVDWAFDGEDLNDSISLRTMRPPGPEPLI